MWGKMIRLTLEEINTVKTCFSKFFNPPDKLWVFGSRVRPDAKGGDIDLHSIIKCATISMFKSTIESFYGIFNFIRCRREYFRI